MVMWVESGFEPDAFWHQTPDSFSLAMRGVRKRLEREAEAELAHAWHVGAFGAAAQSGKLKPLRHYLRKAPERQSPAEMLANLRALQARGAPMRISKIAREQS